MFGNHCQCQGAGVGPHETGKAAVACVLELFNAQRQADIVGPRSHGVDRAPEGFGAGGAEVLHPGHRDEGQAQGQRQRGSAPAHVDTFKTGAQPGGPDIFFFNAGIRDAFLEGFHHQLFGPHVPALPELGTPHADDRYFIFYSRGHTVSSLDPVLSGIGSFERPGRIFFLPTGQRR